MDIAITAAGIGCDRIELLLLGAGSIAVERALHVKF
jgi:hypothetical protein